MNIRRVLGERDYDLLELNSGLWDRALGFTFSKSWFHQPARGERGGPSPLRLKPYRGEGNKINPASKSWCNLLLYDSDGEIAGRFFCAGISPALCERHLSAHCHDPLFPLDWSELMVPDPADPDTARCVLVEIFGDYHRIGRPVLNAADRFSDLFEIDVMLAQVYRTHDGDPSNGLPPDLSARAVTECGFRYRHPVNEKRKLFFPPTGQWVWFEVWAWEKASDILGVTPQTPRLNMDRAALARLAALYQGLTQRQRQILYQLSQTPSIDRVADRTDLSRRRVNDHQREIGEAMGLETLKGEVTGDDRRALERFGIRAETGKPKHLNELLGQKPVSEAIERLAWFYGEAEP